ncbi:MATE family efflux transporter [Rhodobacter calidifons]|uniref:MATE family efflux transporter n=1 Tax=Rhodobacter calidifons TaxID=2715277 RepID=A0ABX0G583_9RHOB|nr:MATE family efflux transporter [Rhodobacter calidifons]NHB76251.1 MATE family efflux transporter [Rhodobacter calidifons]
MTAITHGRMLRIAGPIVLSNATVPLLGAVDTAVIGQLGDPASLGAVGIGAVILATLYWAFGFLRMSTSGLAAQAQGAGDMAERSAVLLRALIVGAGAGLALILAQVALFAGAFWLAPASATVEGLAQDYLAIRIWGAPATIALYALTGWLVGLERTRAVLLLQLWQNGLNIALDLWFVLGLGWGVEGVALATLIAEWTGLALALWLARDAFGPALRGALARLGDGIAIRRMFSASRDIMGRTILLQLAFTTFVFLGARFGDVTLAANQVLMQFLEITAFALDGFAFAAEALVGQAVGARSAADTRAAGRITMQWGFGGAAALALVFALAGPQIIDLMTTAAEVRAAARGYLPWLVLAPLIGVAAWIYDGIFIGALLTGEMLRAMLVSVAVYALALAVLVPLAGNHGLWAALMVMNGARTLAMGRLYPKVLALPQRA